jgi:hypothetical protein
LNWTHRHLSLESLGNWIELNASCSSWEATVNLIETILWQNEAMPRVCLNEDQWYESEKGIGARG